MADQTFKTRDDVPSPVYYPPSARKASRLMVTTRNIDAVIQDAEKKDWKKKILAVTETKAKATAKAEKKAEKDKGKDK